MNHTIAVASAISKAIRIVKVALMWLATCFGQSLRGSVAMHQAENLVTTRDQLAQDCFPDKTGCSGQKNTHTNQISFGRDIGSAVAATTIWSCADGVLLHSRLAVFEPNPATVEAYAAGR